MLDFPPENRDSITEIDGNIMNLIRTRVKDPGRPYSHRSGTVHSAAAYGSASCCTSLHGSWMCWVLVGY